MREAKNIIKVSAIYITTIIGAGFASGQEILKFFTSYYRGGYYGIILTGVLFSVIGYIVLDKVYKCRINNFDEYILPLAGRFIGWIMQITVILFMFCIYCVMLAGIGNIAHEKTGFPYLAATAIFSLVCMFILLGDIKSIVNISTYSAPFIILGILGAGFYIIINHELETFSLFTIVNRFPDNWWVSAILYVGYNTIITVVILCNLLPYLKSRNTGKAGGFIGGSLLAAIALVLNCSLSLFINTDTGVMPMITILGQYNLLAKEFYTAVLWLAMFLSAVTSGFCFIDRLCSKLKINRKLSAIIFCVLAVPLSGVGFSQLISTLYPAFGYIGMFLVILILLQGVADLINWLVSFHKA